MTAPNIRRWARALASFRALVVAGLVLGLVTLAVGLSVVELMLLALWPWPTLALTTVAVSFTAGAAVATWLHRTASELVHERKDVAIDALMGEAFNMERRPPPVAPFGPVALMFLPPPDEPMPEPEPWVLDPPYARKASEVRT